MKIIQIREEIKHHVHTEKEHYIRYGPNDWMIRMYFDVITDDYDLPEESAKELEALYQIELGYKPMSKEDCALLMNADPDCKHVHDPSYWSGIKCHKCDGRFCY